MNLEKVGSLKIRLNKLQQNLKIRRKEGFDTFLEELKAFQLKYYIDMYSITEESKDYDECIRLMDEVEKEILEEEELPITL